MAVTLLEKSRLIKNPYDRAVVETIVRDCDILKIIPVRNIGTLEVVDQRSNSISSVGWRRRGEAYGSSPSGSKDTVKNAVYALGTEVTIDKADYKDKKNNGAQIIKDKTQEAIKGLTWEINDVFINGDHGVNPDQFEGIKVRMSSFLPSTQTIFAVDSTTALDVRPSDATNADLYDWLDKIDEAIDACDGGTADIALTDQRFIRALLSADRRLGLNKVNRSKFWDNPVNPTHKRRTSSTLVNKPVWEYNGVKFFNMGLKRDQSTRVIGDETIASATTPVYFLKTGHPYVEFIEGYGIETTGPNLMDDHVTHKITVDWELGLHLVHPRSMSKLVGSRVA